jgi:outer membrane immunogenic protein
MRKMLCASMAASALMLGPAVAADLSVAPIYKAAPAPVPTWTGSYVGIAAGGTWGSAVVHNNTTGIDQTPGFDLSGAIVGVTTGLQVQNGNVVIGYEGDTSITSKKGSAFEFPPNAGFSNEVRERWLSTFRGRVGVTQSNTWLFYATAGAAVASVDHTITSPAGAAIAEKNWHWGWTAGAGVEVKISPDWSAKMEYLYVGLQDKSYFNPAPVAGFPSNQQVRFDDHVVRVGVNYKLPWNVLDSFFKR